MVIITITGRHYVIFGGPGVGNSGFLSLSSLNGTNGFKFDGEVAGSYPVYSWPNGSWGGSAGDINGDGIADMVIGAYGLMSHLCCIWRFWDREKWFITVI